MNKLARLPAFMDQVHRKMIRGQRLYKDKGFYYSPIRLLNEIQEELVDICGWSYMMWSRLETIKDALGAKALSVYMDDGEVP